MRLWPICWGGGGFSVTGSTTSTMPAGRWISSLPVFGCAIWNFVIRRSFSLRMVIKGFISGTLPPHCTGNMAKPTRIRLLNCFRISPWMNRPGAIKRHIDALIARSKLLLGDNRYRYVFELALNVILDDIRDDLELFGVNYEEWYSERSLTESGAVNKAIEDCAIWTMFTKSQVHSGSARQHSVTKDRVVVRENGQHTYFAADIAYHMDKLGRGFERVIDVWGADHHGYVPRVKAALQAMGDDQPDSMSCWFSSPTSTAAGRKSDVNPLRILCHAARTAQRGWARCCTIFSTSCANASSISISILIWQNPAPATTRSTMYSMPTRVSAVVLRQASEKGIGMEPSAGVENLDRLTEGHEQALFTCTLPIWGVG